mgnify:CR=1 FL=1
MNAAMLEYLYIWLAFVVCSPYEQGVTMANSNQCAYLLRHTILAVKPLMTSRNLQQHVPEMIYQLLHGRKSVKRFINFCVINTPTKMAVKMAKTSHLKHGSVLITKK